MYSMFLGYPHQSIDRWINGQEYTPIPDDPPTPPAPIEILTKIYYKCEGDNDWQQYEVTAGDIVEEENGVVSFSGASFKSQDFFNNVREVKLPNGWKNANDEEVEITNIQNGAFSFCYSLKNVIIPDGIMRIENNAFQNCTSLTNVTIGDTVTSIGNYAFYKCNYLTNVTIPDSVTYIGPSAFNACSRLTNVMVGNNVMQIGENAFHNTPFYSNLADGLIILGKVVCEMRGTCPASVTIPDGVVRIESEAFFGCTDLTNITIPNSVTSIGKDAFKNCNDSLFDTTTIPNGKLVDGWIVDDVDYTLGNLDLTGIRGIGDYALYGCLCTSVTIPNNVISISEYAFCNCSNLVSVVIPDSVACIRQGAFYGSKITNVTIGNGVKSIEELAFSLCSKLTNVIIPDSVETIKSKAFYNSINLTNATITANNGNALKVQQMMIDAGAEFVTEWDMPH